MRGVISVNGFKASEDKLGISNVDVFTDTGSAFDATDMHNAPWTNPSLVTYSGLHGFQGFDQSSGGRVDSHNIAVFQLPRLNAGHDLDAMTDGTNLLKGLGNSGLSRPMNIANAWEGYLVAYQDNNAYVYWADDASSNGMLTADEIYLKMVITGIAENGLTANNFTLI
jgi:hypothetical protein